MGISEYKAMRGLDATVTEDVDALYRHFADEVMPRNRWSWADVALYLEQQLKVKRYRLNRKEQTVFGLLLERAKRNLNVNEFLKADVVERPEEPNNVFTELLKEYRK